MLRYAWDTVMARLGTFVGLTTILVLGTLAWMVTYVAVAMMQGVNFLQPKPLGPTDLLVAQLVGALVGAVIVAPLTAGVYGVIFKILRHQPDPMSGLSAATKYFLPAAGLQLVIGMLTVASTVACQTAFGPLWSSLPNLFISSIIGFFTILIVPTMVGLDLKLGDAVSVSMKRLMSNPFSYLGYFIAAECMSLLGLIACVFGIVLTAGILFVAMALLVTGIVPVPMEGDPGAYPRYSQQQGY